MESWRMALWVVVGVISGESLCLCFAKRNKWINEEQLKHKIWWSGEELLLLSLDEISTVGSSSWSQFIGNPTLSGRPHLKAGCTAADENNLLFLLKCPSWRIDINSLKAPRVATDENHEIWNAPHQDRSFFFKIPPSISAPFSANYLWFESWLSCSCLLSSSLFYLIWKTSPTRRPSWLECEWSSSTLKTSVNTSSANLPTAYCNQCQESRRIKTKSELVYCITIAKDPDSRNGYVYTTRTEGGLNHLNAKLMNLDPEDQYYEDVNMMPINWCTDLSPDQSEMSYFLVSRGHLMT